MYIIVDTTTTKIYKVEGDYPINLVDYLVVKGHHPVVISTYSNTIKYNHHTIEEYGETEVIGSDEVNYLTGFHTEFE